VVWIKIPATKIKPLNFKYKGKTTEKMGFFGKLIGQIKVVCR
jgi:hypothetical protein